MLCWIMCCVGLVQCSAFYYTFCFLFRFTWCCLGVTSKYFSRSFTWKPLWSQIQRHSKFLFRLTEFRHSPCSVNKCTQCLSKTIKKDVDEKCVLLGDIGIHREKLEQKRVVFNTKACCVVGLNELIKVWRILTSKVYESIWFRLKLFFQLRMVF